MTKMIRVENACNSQFKAVVEVWDKGAEGEPDKRVDKLMLSHPTALVQSYITGSRYLVVKEVPLEPAP